MHSILCVVVLVLSSNNAAQYFVCISISFGINAPDAQCTLLYATSLTFSNNDAANAHPNYDMMHSNSCASVINIAIASGAHCTAAIACCCKQSTQCLKHCYCTQIYICSCFSMYYSPSCSCCCRKYSCIMTILQMNCIDETHCMVLQMREE